MLPLAIIRDIDDYSRIINEILKYNITFNILKFTTGSSGVNLLLDVPEDKIKMITDALTQNKVVVNKKGRVIVDDDKCIDCGACLSLCPTDALYFDESLRLKFSYEKCIGCLICLDSCPRRAIEEM